MLDESYSTGELFIRQQGKIVENFVTAFFLLTSRTSMKYKDRILYFSIYRDPWIWISFQRDFRFYFPLIEEKIIPEDKSI